MTKIIYDNLCPVLVFVNLAGRITIKEAQTEEDQITDCVSLSIEEFEELLNTGKKILAEAKKVAKE